MALTRDLFSTKSASGNGTVLLPLEPRVQTGTTDIDDSIQTETTAWPILTMAPATGAPCMNVKVVIDLNKATTGYGAVETTATIAFMVARKVDGTNWRFGAATATVTGTVAATGRSVEIDVGDVSVTEQMRIYAVMSADATSDMELPYMVTYRSRAAATFTEVAAV